MRIAISLFVLVNLLRPAFSQEVPAKEEVIDLHPVEISSPALKNTLLPLTLDYSEANAAPLYYRSVVLFKDARDVTPETWTKIREWLETPVDELPRDEISQTLQHFRAVMGEVAVATRRKHCKWDLPLAEYKEDLFAVLLPELSALRDIGRLLALRARLEIAEGRFDDAIRTMRTGYTMARHISQQPLLIGALVGLATDRVMHEQLLAFIGSEGSPNLYWSIATLPRPPVDLREALILEGNGVYLVFPQLQTAKTSTLSRGEWNEELNGFLRKFSASAGLIADPGREGGLPVVDEDAIERARNGLAQFGIAPEEAAMMPAAKAVLLYTSLTYEQLRDELFKWFFVPYAESRESLEKYEKQLKTESAAQEIIPVAGMLLPALATARGSVARTQRQVEILRVIEAIRHYAASHDNQLPRALSDITSVPVPVNPVTGKPFSYQRDGDEALLDGATDGDRDPVRYRLTISE